MKLIFLILQLSTPTARKIRPALMHSQNAGMGLSGFLAFVFLTKLFIIACSPVLFLNSRPRLWSLFFYAACLLSCVSFLVGSFSNERAIFLFLIGQLTFFRTPSSRIRTTKLINGCVH